MSGTELREQSRKPPKNAGEGKGEMRARPEEWICKESIRSSRSDE